MGAKSPELSNQATLQLPATLINSGRKKSRNERGVDAKWVLQRLLQKYFTRKWPLVAVYKPTPKHVASTYGIHTCQLSWFFRESLSFSSNLPLFLLEDSISRIKWNYCAFLWFSLKFSPFFHKNRTFCFHCKVSGTFLHMFSQRQKFCSSLHLWKRILIPCSSWKRSYNVVRQFVGGG